MRAYLFVLLMAAAVTSAQADFRYHSVSAARWGFSDRAIGMGNCTVEEFEGTSLVPGLQVHVITPAGSYGPTSTLPSRYVTSVDANGSAFVNSQWLGTSALINTPTNQTMFYNNANNWGDIELVFNPPVKIVGFSMYQREGTARVIINGTDRGELGALTGLPQSGTRGGYAVVSATGTDTISTLKIDNQAGDGFVIDHVAFSTVADPVVMVNGVGIWGGTDVAIGMQRAVIENFESTQLNPHLQVEWEAPAGTVGPTNVLPVTFDPVANDPFGTAFQGGVWDGTRGVVTGLGNRTWGYSDSAHWKDVEFQFDRPLALFGISVQQMDADGRLIVNGRDVGSIVNQAGFSATGGRQGYLRIESPSAAIIESVRFAVGGGDGYMLDHLGMRGCGADFNDDAVVDFFDYLDFVAAFSTSDATSDFNADGVVDLFDYLDFVAAFSQGC